MNVVLLLSSVSFVAGGLLIAQALLAGRRSSPSCWPPLSVIKEPTLAVTMSAGRLDRPAGG